MSLTYHVCARRSFFADDVPAICSMCGGWCVHRPHADPGATKICIPCAAWMLGLDNTARVVVSDPSRREAARDQARMKGVQ